MLCWLNVSRNFLGISIFENKNILFRNFEAVISSRNIIIREGTSLSYEFIKLHVLSQHQ